MFRIIIAITYIALFFEITQIIYYNQTCFMLQVTFTVDTMAKFQLSLKKQAEQFKNNLKVGKIMLATINKYSTNVSTLY